MKQTARELAEAHWKFLESWLHIIYVDAMLHGYKHGVDDEKNTAKKKEGAKSSKPTG